jgi:tetratricopeptide (TPR) repeat protein
MSPRTASNVDSIETLLDQAQAFLEEGETRQAIHCYRRAQGLAPFRQDIRDLLAEALDHHLKVDDTSLSGSFSPEDFSTTRTKRPPPQARQRGRGSRFPLASVKILALLFCGLAVAVAAAIFFSRGDESGDLVSRESQPGRTDGSLSTPTSPAALLGEARDALAQQQYEDALAFLDEATALAGEEPESEAAEITEEATGLYAEVFLTRGRMNFSNGRYARALADCTRATEYDPQSAEAHYSLGWTNFYLGADQRNSGDDAAARQRYEDARDTFTKCISLDPTIPNAHRGLALTLMRLDDRAGAFEAFRQEIITDPNGDAADKALRSHGMPIPNPD